MTSSSRPHRWKDPLYTLHIGAGVWKDNLRSSLGSGLCQVWGITGTDTPERVREIVVLRLKRVLDRHTNPKLPEIVWTAYNVGPNADAASGVAARLNRMGDGMSESTCRRKLRPFLEAVEASLDERPQAALTEVDFRLAATWLGAGVLPSAKSPVQGADLRESIRDLRRPEQVTLRKLLGAPLFAPADQDGVSLLARLGEAGDWLCLFTAEDLFAEYRVSSGADWPRCATRLGREFLIEALNRPVPTGVLVNPSSQPGAGVDYVLSLPPGAIAEAVGIG